MRVTTESGAVYEFTKDGGKFRRLRKRHDIDPHSEVERVKLDDDGMWIPVEAMNEPKVGSQMFLMVPEDGGLAVKHTSVVIGIE
jgi:hypothetical protein